ncbi:MAG: hypothetical protein AB1631_16025 [Acidobacteriota bacterium]
MSGPIRKYAPFWMSILASLAAATVSMAGGFYLQVEIPKPNEAQGAALLVRAYGCLSPTDAEITATAEGIVGGERRSVKLDLTHRGGGVYAIRQQWPQEGAWVLAINGSYKAKGMAASALVTLGPSGQVTAKDKGLEVRYSNRRLAARDIDSALSAQRVALK